MTPAPLLYYITDSLQLEAPAGDPGGRAEALLERIRAAFEAGIDWVQIREKHWPARALCRLVERAARLPKKKARSCW